MLFNWIRNIITLALLATLALSCGDDRQYQGNPDLRDNELVQDALNLNNQIVQGNSLAAATSRDRQNLQTIILNVRTGAIALQRNPKDAKALQLIATAMRDINELTVLQEDQFEINKFLKTLASTIEKYLRIQGKTFNDLSFPVFTYRFSSGLTPFGTHASDGGRSKWTTRLALDRWFTSNNIYRPRGPLKSWLLSPTFDLKNIRNPSFRIRHAYNVRNATPEDPFEVTKIINNAFKAVVSTDYSVGDPENATWEEVPLYSRLAAMDFDTGSSNIIDLSEYEGKKIVIAFLVDYDPRIYGGHAVGWTIEQFDLIGLGELPAPVAREGALFEQKFTRKDDVRPFVIANTSEGDFEWRTGGRGATRTDFIIAKAWKRSVVANTWAISPKIDLVNGNSMRIEIDQTVRNPIWENIDIYISDKYDGSNPKTFNDWEKVEFNAPSFDRPNNWNGFTTVIKDMAKYEGKKITLAFNYRADGGQTRPDLWDAIEANDSRNGFIWQVETIRVIGLGEQLDFRKTDLTFDSIKVRD
jgi:hypothetical protein